MTHTPLDNKLIATDIQEKLTQSHSFIDHIVIDDAYADHAPRDKKIAVPQAGTLPEVHIDDSADLDPTTRSDTYVEYNIQSYRTKPIIVRHFDDYFANYDKQESITREQATQLKDTFIKYALYTWTKQALASTGGASRKLLTTGSNRPTSLGTGKRKALTFNDLLSARKQLIKDGGDQSAGNYFAVLNAELYADFLKLTEVQKTNYTLSSPVVKGATVDFLGFTFFLREDLPSFATGAADGALQTISATKGNTASAAAVFFHKGLVRRAISKSLSVFLEVSAGRAGVELSSELFAGSSLARTDAKGFVLLAEATAA